MTRKLNKTEKKLMEQLVRSSNGYIAFESGLARRGYARYSKRYPFNIRERNAARSLAEKGLVSHDTESRNLQGELITLHVLRLP